MSRDRVGPRRSLLLLAKHDSTRRKYIEVTTRETGCKLQIRERCKYKAMTTRTLVPTPQTPRRKAMPPRTRSATHTGGVATRASSTRLSKKVKVPKSPTPGQKRKAVSKKPKSRAGPKPKLEPESESESESGSELEPEPARKRTRHLDAKQDRPRKVAKTLGLKNMPVEVLIEIARYVVPVDLIMLSRVNKFFRELFMDKRSAGIWRSALQNLPELPPCPDDVSEPQYVAMIFTKRCSVGLCGRYAPREMDPALLVRLCARCRDRELVETSRVTDATLVLSSRGLVPGRSHQRISWCLYDEARAVKVKLNELIAAGDQEALRKWEDERRKLVRKRQKAAVPLREWLKDREQEREWELTRLKAAREAEIRSRLIKLGWESADFKCHDDWRHKQWTSMVLNPKPLTEKIWDDILPHLLGHLEINRKQRLEQEKAMRRVLRQHNLYVWFDEIESQLPPFARAWYVRDSGSTDRPMKPMDNRSASAFVPYMVLRQASPTTSQMQRWTEYQAILDNDVSDEQFLVDFEKKKPLFQELFENWQRSLEDQLIRLLPDDTHPANFTSSTFDMVAGSGESVQPMNMLPEGVSKLLRADAIFSIAPGDGAKPYFYPHHFHDFTRPIHDTYYHTKASEIAKALLGALGSPDASYLSLRASNESFQCGRCPSAVARLRSWGELIQHYLDSITLSERIARDPQAQSNKEFVYVCAHDINSEKVGRPLVRRGGEPTGVPPWRTTLCIPCRSFGLNDKASTQCSQAMVDHLRDVHLIETSTPGCYSAY
ncbi:unnamed protein product [Rhizoctonia solani]|uniref:F-box domain-containing protein n=1 Tax=Rhizoctonia solani TaxID=456999 RepID=A0A8H2WTP5_9AGAM|nr:unnamed protein product [Rhizoctonia solani]